MNNVSYYKDIFNFLCRKHPNKKIYIISDHHFYHMNIIKYQRPEFTDIVKMNEYIINKHNSIVEKDAIVIFLGDFCFKKSNIKEILAMMNGYKYLLLGNHDSDNIIKQYNELGFEGIFTTPVKIQDKFLSHFPLCNDELDDNNLPFLIREFNNSNGINYHGHIHNKSINNKHFFNVCCENLNYEPILIGYTEKQKTDDSMPLMINSEDFCKILEFLNKEKNVNPNLLISDYIYSSFLEDITPYNDSYFIYGSYPIYKKYDYISNFSDLDVCQIYNEDYTKSKNVRLLKKTFDTVFENSKKIDNVDIKIYKKFPNLCIFELLYTNKNGNVYKGYYDSNLIPINIYKDEDFIRVSGCSTLERLLKQTDYINNYKFPRYESKFLSLNGDIANLTLQILFQRDCIEKKMVRIKKLKHILSKYYDLNNLENLSSLEDVITRFFIRNIFFFYVTRRKDDIEYIIESYKNISEYIDIFPNKFKLMIEEILKNQNSLFNFAYDELMNSSFEEIPSKSQELIKTLK